MEGITNTDSNPKNDDDNSSNSTKFNRKKPLNKSKKFKKPNSNIKNQDDANGDIDVISSSSTKNNRFGEHRGKNKELNRKTAYPSKRKSSTIEILSVKTRNSGDEGTNAETELPRNPADTSNLTDSQKSKPMTFKEFKTKAKKSNSFDKRKGSDGLLDDQTTKEATTEKTGVSFEHKKISMDLLKANKKNFDKKKNTKAKPTRKPYTQDQIALSNKEDARSSPTNSKDSEDKTEQQECNTIPKKFQKKKIPEEILSVISVGVSKKDSEDDFSQADQLPEDESAANESNESIVTSPPSNMLSDETHIPLKYRSSTPNSSSGSGLTENNSGLPSSHPGSNGNAKSCPYLNRLKGNGSTNPKTDSGEEKEPFDKDTKPKVEKKKPNPDEPVKPSPFKSLLGNSGTTSDFFNSLLNETLLNEDHAWQPTPLIDISQINSAFEAPKLTENTSTIVMTNAEKELLSHRGEQKNADDNGGPYVLKLSNLQKGFNSEVLVETILKPKKLLFLRTKFFWEPNFKVTVDDLKKLCFLELKYFEEIDRCIKLLKNNNYLIKVEKCSHDDFSKIANLQNMKWGDPEFIDLSNSLIYKLVKYKVNLNGDPIGVLKEGEEEEADSGMKLPSLPTLGNSNATKKNTGLAESMYSKLSSQIITNKEKSRRDSINNGSGSNSPSVNSSPLVTSENLTGHSTENNPMGLATSTSPISSSHPVNTGPTSKSSHTPGGKFGGFKPHTKSKFSNLNNGSQFSTNRYKNQPANSTNTSRSTSNSPRFFDSPDNKSFGFASGFVKNTGSRY